MTSKEIVQDAWQTLPQTPSLPQPDEEGRMAVPGAELWYGRYGTAAEGNVIVLLHGGLANSAYYGQLIPALVAGGRAVLAIDSRGHGRSSSSTKPYGYELMANDVLAVLRHLKLGSVDIVGWSDGGTIGYLLAMRQESAVARVIAFGANCHLNGLRTDYDQSPVFQAYLARTEKEYVALSKQPDGFSSFVEAISNMWACEPAYTSDDLAKVECPVRVLLAEHDEGILPDHARMIAKAVPNGKFMIVPGGSHFAMLQVPETFNDAIMRALVW